MSVSSIKAIIFSDVISKYVQKRRRGQKKRTERGKKSQRTNHLKVVLGKGGKEGGFGSAIILVAGSGRLRGLREDSGRKEKRKILPS